MASCYTHSAESTVFNMAIFRDSIFSLSDALKEEYQNKFYRKKLNFIKSKYLGLFRAGIQCHSFSKVFLENNSGRVLLLV